MNGVGSEARVSVAVCPPFPYLSLVGEILKGSGVALGAIHSPWHMFEARLRYISTGLFNTFAKFAVLGKDDFMAILNRATSINNNV